MISVGLSFPLGPIIDYSKAAHPKKGETEMSGNAVRKRFMKSFVGYEKHSRATAFSIIAAYLGQVIAAVAFGNWVLQLHFSFLTGLVLALVAFFIGTRLRGFNNIVHECSHATFAKTRADNVLCGSICASLILGCFQNYRDEHLTHHAHLGDYDKDMDLHGIRDLRLEEPLSPLTIMRHVLTPFLGLHLPYYLGCNLSARDGAQFRILKLALIAAATGFLILEPLAALLLVWAPFLWVYSTINYWTDCIDHGGLLEAEDELQASRNVLLPTPLKLLLFPRNDCYHLVHHLFPQVPARHFDTCHKQLLTHPDYSARLDGLHNPSGCPAVANS